MITRKLLFRDIYYCCKLIEDEYDALSLNFYHQILIDSVKSVNSTVHVFVVEDNGKIVGFIAYFNHPSFIATAVYNIKTVIVKSNYRNTGIGKHLIDTVINDVKNNNGDMIMLSTSIPEYYEKHWGFIRCFEYKSTQVMRLEL